MVCRVIRIALVLLIAANIPVNAQENRDKGFIGVGLGPTFILGKHDVEPGAGLNLTLLNAGYIFGKGFGVNAVWAGGAHAFDSEVTLFDSGSQYTLPAKGELSYGVLMIGPMYTLTLSDKSSVDLKARLGSLYIKDKITSESVTSTAENRTLGASLGVGYRRKVANRWCLMLSSDYYAGKQRYSFATSQSTQVVSFTGGVGFAL